jgi:hypothetical protein
MVFQTLSMLECGRKEGQHTALKESKTESFSVCISWKLEGKNTYTAHSFYFNFWEKISASKGIMAARKMEV